MKKPSKRKMYQKRRKKEKAEQRRKASQTTKLPETSTTTAAASFYKYNNNNNKQHQKNKQNDQPTTTYNNLPNPITAYSQGLQLWWQTYCSAIEFHCKQQNLWKDEDKQREMMLLEMYANEYETSSDEEEEEDKEDCECEQINTKNGCSDLINENTEEAYNVDEEYIKFLEITHRHREELRLKRAQDNI